MADESQIVLDALYHISRLVSETEDAHEALRLILDEVMRALPATSASIALVNSPEVVLTGAQVSFGYQLPDTRLAFDRLKKELTQAATTPGKVFFASYYSLSLDIANQVRQVRSQVFDAGQPPAGTLLLFEGLPSMDAGFAVDAMAVK